MGAEAQHIDVNVESTGSNFFLVEPRSEYAQEWVEENVQVQTWYGDAFICEQRHAETLVCGMTEEGLRVALDEQPVYAEDGVVYFA